MTNKKNNKNKKNKKVGGNCRLDFYLEFPPIKTQIGRIIKEFVATEKTAVFDAQQLDGYENTL